MILHGVNNLSNKLKVPKFPNEKNGLWWAENDNVIEGEKITKDEGITDSLLIGDEKRIKEIVKKLICSI